MHYLKWPVDLLNVFKSIQRSSNTSVQAENLILYNSGKWKPVE